MSLLGLCTNFFVGFPPHTPEAAQNQHLCALAVVVVTCRGARAAEVTCLKVSLLLATLRASINMGGSASRRDMAGFTNVGKLRFFYQSACRLATTAGALQLHLPLGEMKPLRRTHRRVLRSGEITMRVDCSVHAVAHAGSFPKRM